MNALTQYASPVGHDKHSVAKKLISTHFDVEPNLERVLYFETEDDDLITLLEVSGSTPASGSIEAFVFSPTKGVPFSTRIAEITPDEYERFRTDPPGGWDFSKAQIFERPEA